MGVYLQQSSMVVAGNTVRSPLPKSQASNVQGPSAAGDQGSKGGDDALIKKNPPMSGTLYATL